MEFEYELFPFHKYKIFFNIPKTNDLQDENLIGRPLDSGINQEPHLRLNTIYFIVKKKKQRLSSSLCDIFIVIYYKYNSSLLSSDMAL
jgi:hypothetical protein